MPFSRSTPTKGPECPKGFTEHTSTCVTRIHALSRHSQKLLKPPVLGGRRSRDEMGVHPMKWAFTRVSRCFTLFHAAVFFEPH